MTAKLLIGDVRAVVATLEDASIDLVFSSPPFLALRSYLDPSHPDKALEIGSESTPGEFIDTLLDVIEALEPKMAPHGSICIELGDTYAGSGGAGGDYNEGGLREGAPGGWRQANSRRDKQRIFPERQKVGSRPMTQSARRDKIEVPRNLTGGDGWPLDKSLCLIPELFRIALVYGFNPLTGRTTPHWRARNVIRWCRPNPPVGALGDKFRPATSEIVVLCKSRSRYFDLDAVRTEAIDQRTRTTNGAKNRTADPIEVQTANYDHRVPSNAAGAPPLDWWELPTHGYPGAHYATFPESLCVKPIETMCPRHVCLGCGKPRERVIGEPEYQRTDSDRVPPRLTMLDGQRPAVGANTSVVRTVETLGWSECGCGDGCRPTTWKIILVPVIDPETGLPVLRKNGKPKVERHRVIDDLGQCSDPSHWRAGVVLDPFAGSGTTLAVAVGHSRNAIGIDLDARNARLVEQRLGMFLEVDTPQSTVDVAVGVAL